MTTMTGKPLASLSEAYKAMYYGVKNIPRLKRAMNKGLISKHFNSRIMLAVTEVNGCNLCSYGHTTIALESGMTEEEINQLLGGASTDSPLEEQAALLFAQSVADTRGAVSKKAWEHLVTIYGEKQSKAILASVEVIMMGNTFGIPIGSLFSRVSKKDIFKKDDRTTLSYEWTMFIAAILFLPVSILHNVVALLFRRPQATFY